jgi:hypothetical protein
MEDLVHLIFRFSSIETMRIQVLSYSNGNPLGVASFKVAGFVINVFTVPALLVLDILDGLV